MDYQKESLRLHYEWAGKLEYKSKIPLNDAQSLSLAYTPGVASACLEIAADKSRVYDLTGRHNLVAVITDGSAVLGLGDIGPEAALPVMEGKCAIFKSFGNVDAIALCLRTKDVDEIVNTVSLLAGSFGGINLEDISAPRCFEIERRLQERCDIPVFHDDQHGTAVVVLAALYNALKITNRKKENVKCVICGAGAAGLAIMRLLRKAGFCNIIMCDSSGVIYRNRHGLSGVKAEIAELTNQDGITGGLSDALRNADVFIGVSGANMVTADMVRSMAKDAILFPMANPNPEIMPETAHVAGAAIVGTGRSDFPNQINNALAFPGIFRGALDVRASEINDEMKLAAANTLAGLAENNLSENYILPKVFDPLVGLAVASAVSEAARSTNVSRI